MSNHEKKNISNDVVNTKAYWNDRFVSGSWDERSGREQSAFFAKVAIESFPAWFFNRLQQNEWTFIDYGCAEGSGTSYIAMSFPSLKVTGMDFSEEAVSRAKERHANCNFSVGDITKEIKKADVIFTSNTLEHLRTPKDILENLVNSSCRYTVLLLPFEDESGIDEHFNVFNASFFPEFIGEHYLQFYTIIDCNHMEPTYWYGRQILLIYSNVSEKQFQNNSISDHYENNILPLVEQLRDCREAIAQLKEENSTKAQEYETAVQQAREECERKLQEKQNEYQELLQQKKDDCIRLEEACSQLQAEKENLMNTVQEKELRISKLQESEKAKAENLESVTNTIKAIADTKEADSKAAIEQVSAVSRLRLYRIAHLLTEIRYAFWGTKEERAIGKKYLFHSRKTITKHNYMEAIRQSIRLTGETKELREQIDLLRTGDARQEE